MEGHSILKAATLVAGCPIGTARRLVARTFKEADLDTPELDARILVGHALGLAHSALIASADRLLSAFEVEKILAFAKRRLAHEPVARILGVKEFWGLSLQLNAAMLVPRPETETVVEAATAAAGNDLAQVRRIADLGTGSGALLLALLSALPSACGIGTDISVMALQGARDNAAALKLGGRAAFVVCDFGTALQPPFDLVVANPPYIPQADIQALAPDVRLFDPRAALDGGEDGQDAYRAIAADACRLLGKAGALIMELGIGQASAVAGILNQHGLAVGRVYRDLAGIERAIVARTIR